MKTTLSTYVSRLYSLLTGKGVIRLKRLNFFDASLGYLHRASSRGGGVHSRSIRFRGIRLHVDDAFHGGVGGGVALRHMRSAAGGSGGMMRAARTAEGTRLRLFLGRGMYVGGGRCVRLDKLAERTTVSRLGGFVQRKFLHHHKVKESAICIQRRGSATGRV